MGKEFLENNKNLYHPLYKDYWAIQKLLAGSLDADKSRLVKEVLARTTAIINAFTFSSSSKKKEEKLFSFGDFSSLGSEEVRIDIEGRLGTVNTTGNGKRKKGKKTESIISELCVASWLLQQCSDFMALQDDAMPDFVCLAKSVLVECKTFVKAKNIQNFLDKHIRKADKQLGEGVKKYGEKTTGVLVFDLTGYFQTLEPCQSEDGFEVYPKEYFINLDEEISARIRERKNIHWVMYYWDEVFPCVATCVSQLRASKWVKNPKFFGGSPPLEGYGLRVAMNVYSAPPNSRMRRNSLCFCGSGKRFKFCHGSIQ